MDNIREMIRLREEADALERSRLYNAEKRGRTAGKNDAIREIVKTMLTDKHSKSEISELLHIPVEDIEKIQTSE